MHWKCYSTNRDLRVQLAGTARSLIEQDFDIDRNAAIQRQSFGCPAATRQRADELGVGG